MRVFTLWNFSRCIPERIVKLGNLVFLEFQGSLYDTNPRCNALVLGKFIKMTIHLYLFDPPKKLVVEWPPVIIGEKRLYHQIFQIQNSQKTVAFFPFSHNYTFHLGEIPSRFWWNPGVLPGSPTSQDTNPGVLLQARQVKLETPSSCQRLLFASDPNPWNEKIFSSHESPMKNKLHPGGMKSTQFMWGLFHKPLWGSSEQVV